MSILWAYPHKSSLRAAYLPIHVYFGLAIFVLACSTCLTGITQKLIWSLNDEYKNRVPAGTLANCLGIFIVLFGMLVVYLATNIGYKRQEKH